MTTANSHAVGSDPFFVTAQSSRMPSRPRFISELVYLQVDDSIVVDGAGQLCVIKGKASRIVGSLIPFMDGTRSEQDLSREQMLVPTDVLRATVSLLNDWGFVEDARPGEATISTCPTLSFFRRFLGVTGANRNGEEARERLACSEAIILAGSSMQEQADQSELLRSMLKDSGVGSVRFLHRESLKEFIQHANVEPQTSLFISLGLFGEDLELHFVLDDLCREHGLTWLRFVLDERLNFADLGPLFRGNEGPCYRCFREVHCEPGEYNVPRASSVSTDADGYFWTSVVALEAIYLLSGIGLSVAGGGVRRYDLEGKSWRDLRLTRIPGCRFCHPVPFFVTDNPPADSCTTLHASRRFTSTAFVFEDYVSLHAAPVISPKARYVQSRLGKSLSRQAKQLSNCPQVALLRQEMALELLAIDSLVQNRSSECSSRFTVGELSTLLMTTAGLRGTQKDANFVDRWAASAGNLGSVELFLAVRDVEGLDRGLYFYQAPRHSLALFCRRDGTMEIEEFMQRAFVTDCDKMPNLILVFTGAFHRVARKYGSFALKLINLDAGVAFSQLQLVASGLGLSCQLITRWADDLLEDQLNLASFQEQVTAAVALYHGPEPSGSNFSPRVGRKTPEQIGSHSPKVPSDFWNLTLANVCEKLFKESRTTEKDLQLSPRAVPIALSCEPHSDTSGVQLPNPCRGGLTIGDTLGLRTSARCYSPEPVSIEQLSTILAAANQGDRRDWSQERELGLSLTFLALLTRTRGVEPGVYVYDPHKHSLIPYAKKLTLNQCTELFLQSEFALAPVTIWIVGNLAAACAQHGEGGYRQLLLRAGAAGHRLWMAGVAMGLVGTLTAGVVAGAARRHLDLNEYTRASLLAFPTGHPHDLPSASINRSVAGPRPVSIVENPNNGMNSNLTQDRVPNHRQVPMQDSGIFIEGEFFRNAKTLRDEFVERLSSKQQEGITPFTYAFCDDRYQFLTANAESLFSPGTLADFMARVRDWAAEKLSVRQVSTPQVRVYIRGCSRSFLKDEIDARWHFVLPLLGARQEKLLRRNRAKIFIDANSDSSIESRADMILSAELEFNCLLVHAVNRAYRIDLKPSSMNPIFGIAFVDGYLW